MTAVQRHDATELFNDKKIKKKYAFGGLVLPWDKPDPPPPGAPSALEGDLRRDVQATARRRRAQELEAEAAAMRDAARPRFDVTVRKGAVVSPHYEATSFELFAQGRVPELRVRMGHMRLSPAVATAVEVAGGGGSSSVMVTVNAMRILPQPLCSRKVEVVAGIASASRAEPANLRFDAALFESVRATAYER